MTTSFPEPRTVTPEDLEFGWRCESCHRLMHLGEPVFGVITGVIDGCVVESDFRCGACWKDNT